MKSPIPVFTGHEAARVLGVNQVRFSRAVRKGVIVPDFIANGARGIDLFLPGSVRTLRRRKDRRRSSAGCRVASPALVAKPRLRLWHRDRNYFDANDAFLILKLSSRTSVAWLTQSAIEYINRRMLLTCKETPSRQLACLRSHIGWSSGLYYRSGPRQRDR